MVEIPLKPAAVLENLLNLIGEIYERREEGESWQQAL